MFWIFNIPYADPVPMPLATGPGPIFLIVSSYLLFVLKMGPQFMANREPFQLRGLLKVYNLIQILFNTLIFVKTIHLILAENPYDFNCMMIMPLDHKLKSLDRILVYSYYINKLLDLLDTVFIVLRKSYKQITWLHVIHHVYMATAGYSLLRFYGYGGHIIVTGLLNQFVHIVMYTYYYLSAQNPIIKRSLWWKRYITIIQMVQFIMMFGHSAWTLSQSNCEVPRTVIYLVMIMSAFMLLLFINFYLRSYVFPKKKTIQDKLK